MKKLISMSTTLFFLLSSQSFAFYIIKTELAKDGYLHYYLGCNNGDSVIVSANLSTSEYYGLNDKLYYSLTDAATSKGCD